MPRKISIYKLSNLSSHLLCISSFNIKSPLFSPLQIVADNKREECITNLSIITVFLIASDTYFIFMV